MHWPLSILVTGTIVIQSLLAQEHPSLPSYINDIIRKVDDNTPKRIPERELTPDDLHQEYDFIIIGSGPAGCVLANRLTENPLISVLLLEAGGRPQTVHSIPAFASFTLLPETRWDFTITPQPGICSGQGCDYSLGKALGGSSAVNYMDYVRGNRHDFDRWEEMGNYGWGFEDILPLFRRMENATLLQRTLNPDYRGVKGELTISQLSYRSHISELFIRASEARGLPFRDFNGELGIGADYTQTTTKNGRRVSAADAYLTPIKDRRNLHVILNSLVSKVIIDPEKKTAQGVEYTYQGVTHTVFAQKEVILSGGPIKSPQLLWLSGIGPKKDLEKFNITVFSDLPVGMTYLDHVCGAPVSARTNWLNETIDLKRITSDDIKDLLVRGTGKLTVPYTVEVVTMQNNGFSAVPSDNANLEMLFYTGKNLVALEDDAEDGQMSLLPINLYPETKGRLRMSGHTINHVPTIEYPFFENPKDLESLVWGAKEAVALLTSEELKATGAVVNIPQIPDCVEHVFNSDDYWRCNIRHRTRSMLHAAATNKMGPEDDPEAVVDPELRVYGIEKLRVADSSIAPTTVACHTQAVSYVVGEKLAELLKLEWGI